MTTHASVFAGLCVLALLPSGGATPVVSAMAGRSEIRSASMPTDESPAWLLDLTDEELKRRVESDLPSLGSLTIGAPSGAILVNAVEMPEGPRWILAPTAETWGTSETMASVQTAIDKVHELFPETQPIFIGDISDVDGGRLKRHQTHQAGRDVDFGFYYKGGKAKWYEPGMAANLDLPRNWALVRALITCTDVETILLDTRIQKQLYRYALSIFEDKNWLDRVFQFSKWSRDAVIRHVPLHRTHYHVRFYNPVAQELGRRAFPFLVEAKVVQPPVYTLRHVVLQGQTLGLLARRYGVSTRAIMQANGLRSTQIRAGRAYRIPVKAAAPPVAPVVVPLRALPPETPVAVASVEWPTLQSLYGDRLGALLDLPWVLGFPGARF